MVGSISVEVIYGRIQRTLVYPGETYGGLQRCQKGQGRQTGGPKGGRKGRRQGHGKTV